jgi:hypothetical protein
MSEASELDIELALRHPKSCFAEPNDVVGHPTLSHETKRAILREWEQDARRLSASESEGFGGGEESMLGRVESALASIEKQKS